MTPERWGHLRTLGAPRYNRSFRRDAVRTEQPGTDRNHYQTPHRTRMPSCLPLGFCTTRRQHRGALVCTSGTGDITDCRHDYINAANHNRLQTLGPATSFTGGSTADFRRSTPGHLRAELRRVQAIERGATRAHSRQLLPRVRPLRYHQHRDAAWAEIAAIVTSARPRSGNPVSSSGSTVATLAGRVHGVHCSTTSGTVRGELLSA